MTLSLRLDVSITEQKLRVFGEQKELAVYSVSTAINGPGEQENSGCTPRGNHIIRAKIGHQQPQGSVFVGRRATGEVYSESLAETHPNRDWILSRILWLCGTEVGKNRLGKVDSQRRYIYIHGTPDSEPMGEPLSHGCIRMRNNEVIELFDKVQSGTEVFIHE